MSAIQAVPIRDAACVVLADCSASQPKLLLGQRHADQVFLPSKWVFPGGRVDDADHDGAAVSNALPGWLQTFARAAIRELAEETGIAWPGELTPLARAVTPPGRVRRYDTWFFLAQASADFKPILGGDGELLHLSWHSIEQARRLDLPNITRLVLDDAAALLDGGRTAEWRAPFYYPTAAGFARGLIDCRAADPPP